MNTTLRLFLFFAITFFTACKKDLIEVTLPADVNLGESIIYLNGEVTTDFKPDFLALLPVHQLIHFAFVFEKPSGEITAFAFDFLPMSTGEYTLTTEREAANAILFQSVSDVAGKGTEFKLIHPQDGFFNIEAIDTAKMEVKGRFRARFKRTFGTGNSAHLPKYVQFDGVFYEKYRKI